ncbi:MAG: hypothetical protein Q4C00_03210 [Bacillota bacterium]|nr:hypothetical protein [Bacillota bacterium]
MGKFKKTCKKMAGWDFKNIFCFGLGYVRTMIFTSMILLLLYSLVFHNFIIIFVILLQALALAGTFYN